MSESTKSGILPFPVSTGTAQDWARWKRTVEFYFTAEKIKEADQKQAKLITLGGKEIQDLYYSLPVVTELPADTDVYSYTLECLDAKIGTESTKWYERYVLAQIKQGEKETTTSFTTRVRNQALKCEYTAAFLDEAVQGQLVNGCYSNDLRMELMRAKASASLSMFESIMRTYESINKQSSVMAGKSSGSSNWSSNWSAGATEAVNKVTTQSKRNKFEKKRWKGVNDEYKGHVRGES